MRCTAPLFGAVPAVKGDGWFIGGFRGMGDGAPGAVRPTEMLGVGRRLSLCLCLFYCFKTGIIDE